MKWPRLGQEVIFSMRHNKRHWTKATVIGLPSDLVVLVRFEDGAERLVPKNNLR